MKNKKLTKSFRGIPSFLHSLFSRCKRNSSIKHGSQILFDDIKALKACCGVYTFWRHEVGSIMPASVR
jgi:hypothetical protein